MCVSEIDEFDLIGRQDLPTPGVRASPRSCASAQRKQGLHEHHARRARSDATERVAEVEPEWHRVDAEVRAPEPIACFGWAAAMPSAGAGVPTRTCA